MNQKPTAKRLCQIVAAAIAALMVICMILPVLYADVIFEPRDNFYEKHREDMEYIDKVYIANASTEGYESPEDDDVLLTASEGTRLYISFAYTDDHGEKWGVYDWDTTTCWFRLSELQPVYDSRDFAADHGSEFTYYTDELDTLLPDGSEMPMWSYPGSATRTGLIYLDEYFTPSDYADSVYTDPMGRAWVYIPYYHGGNGWVNASDPLNPEPVVFDANATEATPAPTEEPAAEATIAPTPTPLPTETIIVDDTPTGGHPMGLSVALLIVLAIAAVGFVVLLSAVLIIVFFVVCKKKKTNAR